MLISMWKLILFVALARLLVATDKPSLCAVIWTGLVFLHGLLFSMPLAPLAVHTAVTFAVAYVYFRLLSRFEEWILLWLAAVGVGFFVVSAVPGLLASLIF